MNFWHVTRNIMAREKALYEGHAVAAVAATIAAIADEALALIEVDYEVLPHVIDVEEAMAPDAPLLHEDMFTRGVEPKPTKPSNIAKRLEFKKGDVEAGFADADVVIEKEFKTAAGAPGLYRAACLRRDVSRPTARARSGQLQPGPFHDARADRARSSASTSATSACTPAEIGGGFGGKTVIYLEPVAVALSKKSGLPVKMQMTREEVFRGSGPTSGASM